MIRSDFRAMGTSIRVVTGEASPDLITKAERSIEDTFRTEERRFSRFRSDSELSRLNAAAGRSVRVSAVLADVLGIALRAAQETDGLFDPTVLNALAAAGYDRDFDEVVAGARGVLHPARPCGRWREIVVDGDRVRLPSGTGIDLGGLVKGWTADLAASRALDAGLPWVVVNAGGDLRVAGRAPLLSVAVEDPDDPDRELGRLHIDHGGLATSSIRSRSWGEGSHHLIDPRTGAPSRTELVQVTAVGATSADAEVAAKAILLGGTEAIEGAALTVWSDGHVEVHVPVEEAA